MTEADTQDAGLGSSPPSDGSATKKSTAALLGRRAFYGMTLTQFLGAFNDSVFKQIVLLLLVSVLVMDASSSGTLVVDRQMIAQGVFALAFILFSGVAGWWSDRTGKRGLIVLCKVAEILVMLAAVAAFALLPPRIQEGQRLLTDGTPWLLLAVLFLMGVQSAVFGPSKYGILPELVPQRELPLFNGAIQMTTFMALIFGTAFAGLLMLAFAGQLWMAALVCVGIAVLGTLTSLLIPRTQVAEPGAPFDWSSVVGSKETWSILMRDRKLAGALIVYSVFWFVAAIIPMAVNSLGKNQLGLDDAQTSFMLTYVSAGIALGFITASLLSSKRVSFKLVRIGTFGMIVCLPLLALPGGEDRGHLLGYYGSQVVLAVIGIFAGFFALPVQVFLQSRPPKHLKGRVIGAMNLVNWVAMIFSAVFYGVCVYVFNALEQPHYAIFAVVALLLIPIAVLYHPADEDLA